MPFQDFTFVGFAFAQGIDTEFTEDKWFGIGEYLQPRKIISERLPLVEIDIEANKIGASRAKKFGRGVTGKGAETFGIGAFGDGDELVNEVRDSFGPAPTDDVGRDFIGNAESKNGRMARAGLNGLPDGFAGLRTVIR